MNAGEPRPAYFAVEPRADSSSAAASAWLNSRAMTAVAGTLSDDDIESLAQYIANLR